MASTDRHGAGEDSGRRGASDEPVTRRARRSELGDDALRQPSEESGAKKDPKTMTRAEYHGRTAKRKKEPSKFASTVREFGIIIGTALVLSLLVKTFLLQAFWIPSESMENTLVPGDRVIVSKLTPGVQDLERGDIVVFEDPGNWLPPVEQPDRGPVFGALHKSMEFVGLAPTESTNFLIKRVIGLPGDNVKCCDAKGNLMINDQTLNETALYPGDVPSEMQFDITVPEGKIWVMGDHRSDSGDSRIHDGPESDGSKGSVPIDNVVGRAILLAWPFERFGTLDPGKMPFEDIPDPEQ